MGPKKHAECFTRKRALRKRDASGMAETDKRGSWSLHTGAFAARGASTSGSSCAWLANEKQEETLDLLPQTVSLIRESMPSGEEPSGEDEEGGAHDL